MGCLGCRTAFPTPQFGSQSPPSSSPCPHPTGAQGCGGGGWLCLGPPPALQDAQPGMEGGGGEARGVGPSRALTPSRSLFPAFWLRRGPRGAGSVCDGGDGVGPESILSYCRFLPELQITVSHPLDPPAAPPQGRCRGSAGPLTPGPRRAGGFARRVPPSSSPPQGPLAASWGHQGSQWGVCPPLPGAADPTFAPFAN